MKWTLSEAVKKPQLTETSNIINDITSEILTVHTNVDK